MENEIRFLNGEFMPSDDPVKDVALLAELVRKMHNDETRANRQLAKIFEALRFSGMAGFNGIPSYDAAERILGAFIAASSGK